MKLKLTTTLFFATILFFSMVDYANAGMIKSMNPNFWANPSVIPSGVPITVSGTFNYWDQWYNYWYCEFGPCGDYVNFFYKIDGIWGNQGSWGNNTSLYYTGPFSRDGTSYSFPIGSLTPGPHTIEFKALMMGDSLAITETYSVSFVTAPPPPPLTATIFFPVNNPTTYGTGSNISFSGYASGGSSSDGLNTYEWREGQCTTGALLASTQFFQKSNFAVGAHTVYFRVKDSTGTWSTNCPSRTVNISANGVPTAVITDPVNTSLVIAPGGSIFFSGYGIDPDGDTITQYTWSRSSATGGWPTTVGTASSFSLNFPSVGNYYVYLGVKDSNNNWSTNQATRYVSVASSPSATISASPNTCTIASGASTCNIPFTWNIINAVTPNIYNATRAIQYSTSASGNNLSYAITNGSNTVQARRSTNVLNWVVVTGSCVGGTSWNGSSCVSISAPCTLESTTIPSGGSITAYQFSSVPSPNTCSSVSETRNCNNGVLSGSYQNAFCSVNTSCDLPWTGTIASGNSVTAYQASSVTSPTTCASVSQTRTCTNGVLSGSGTYDKQNCTASAVKTRFWQF